VRANRACKRYVSGLDLHWEAGEKIYWIWWYTSANIMYLRGVEYDECLGIVQPK